MTPIAGTILIVGKYLNERKLQANRRLSKLRSLPMRGRSLQSFHLHYEPLEGDVQLEKMLRNK